MVVETRVGDIVPRLESDRVSSERDRSHVAQSMVIRAKNNDVRRHIGAVVLLAERDDVVRLRVGLPAGYAKGRSA